MRFVSWGLVPAAAFAVVVLSAATSTEDGAAHHRERIEWCDIWFTDADKHDLPRVLLIGDSIARGYFHGVENELAGKAYCGRLTSSRSVCDPVFFQELALLLGQHEFEVIHFNNGLHGWGYTEDEYREGFRELLVALQDAAPAAHLVCALTTPVQPDSAMGEHAERVGPRNQIAHALCAEAGIPTNDLHALAEHSPRHFSGDGIHFNSEGKAAQSRQVAEAIAALMPQEGVVTP